MVGGVLHQQRRADARSMHLVVSEQEACRAFMTDTQNTVLVCLTPRTQHPFV